MAVVCSITTSPISPFSFLDCGTVSISYDIRGLATVSFTVVSNSASITLSGYTTVEFGSNTSTRTTGPFSAGRVRFKGTITNYELVPIPGTLVYEHKIQLLGWGCRI